MTDKPIIQEEKNKFSKSVTAGMKSIFGGKGRTYYILEHKTASEKHRAGETQEIIIDYIELGRDPHCQVGFGNTFPTVSRRHASITKDNNNWVIRQLSQTNPTLINGKPIKSHWFLQNGDEIQLSLEGPRLGFMVPANSSVGTLGLTRRLDLFRKQALKPYKQALMLLSMILVLAIGGLSWYLLSVRQELAITQQNLAQAQVITQSKVDSMVRENEASRTVQEGLQKTIVDLQQKITDLKSRPSYSQGEITPPAQELEVFERCIYFILSTKIEIQYQGKMQVLNDYNWSGTGFLLTDGRFITARHVIWPWAFFNREDQQIVNLNLLANNGAKLTAYFTAYSPDGSSFSFTSNNFKTDSSADQYKEVVDENGNRLIISDAGLNNGKDWASYYTGMAGNIKFDNYFSQDLERGSVIQILGYPFGLSLQDNSRLQCMYSKSEVGQSGLVNGMINITARGFDHGNSGGPAFASKDGELYAVGIISASMGAIGNIVPISAAR